MVSEEPGGNQDRGPRSQALLKTSMARPGCLSNKEKQRKENTLMRYVCVERTAEVICHNTDFVRLHTGSIEVQSRSEFW
jgi:hypothetical protein